MLRKIDAGCGPLRVDAWDAPTTKGANCTTPRRHEDTKKLTVQTLDDAPASKTRRTTKKHDPHEAQGAEKCARRARWIWTGVQIKCIYTHMASPQPHGLDECAGCACFAVRRAARAITQHYDRALRPSGLRATQFTVLTMLALGGPTPLCRVADRLGMERTTLTRNLKPLLAGSLIRVDHAADRRVRTIAITPQGHHTAVAALPYWREAQRNVAGHLTRATFSSLDTVTARLARTRAHGSRASTKQHPRR